MHIPASPIANLSKRFKIAVFGLFFLLISSPAWAATCKSCGCWYHTNWEDEPACISFCQAQGMEYSGFDGLDQCSCSSTTMTSCPTLPNQGGGSCSDVECGTLDPQPVPEMSDYLTLLFVAAGGGVLYYLRRSKAA